MDMFHTNRSIHYYGIFQHLVLQVRLEFCSLAVQEENSSWKSCSFHKCRHALKEVATSHSFTLPITLCSSCHVYRMLFILTKFIWLREFQKRWSAKFLLMKLTRLAWNQACGIFLEVFFRFYGKDHYSWYISTCFESIALHNNQYFPNTLQIFGPKIAVCASHVDKLTRGIELLAKRLRTPSYHG